jgi:hypothetical protein
MSHFTPRTAKPLTQRKTATGRRPLLVTGAVGLALAAGVTAAALTGAGSSDRAGGLDRTGEVNSMGMPVVETPGAGTGTSEAAGVVVEDATWALGQVPLNVAVRPTWTLRNTSGQTVTLGEPHPEVREGCCPGPATLGSHSLEPGASTTLTFELSMHPGMDGPHDLGLHVPVDDGTGGDQFLTLDVTGDFRS